MSYRDVDCANCGRHRVELNGVCEKCGWDHDADPMDYASVTRPNPAELADLVRRLRDYDGPQDGLLSIAVLECWQRCCFCDGMRRTIQYGDRRPEVLEDGACPCGYCPIHLREAPPCSIVLELAPASSSRGSLTQRPLDVSLLQARCRSPPTGLTEVQAASKLFG